MNLLISVHQFARPEVVPIATWQNHIASALASEERRYQQAVADHVLIVDLVERMVWKIENRRAEDGRSITLIFRKCRTQIRQTTHKLTVIVQVAIKHKRIGSGERTAGAYQAIRRLFVLLECRQDGMLVAQAKRRVHLPIQFNLWREGTV